MKKTIRLTESDLINLVQKIVKEQSYDESAFEEHMGTIDHIANHFNNETTEDELDFMLTQIEYELDSAVRGGELTDDELEELYDYANEIAGELEHEFRLNMDLHEGTKAKKSKAMRSKRSGIKTQKVIDQNHKVLKKLVSEQPESRFGPEQFMSQSERRAYTSGTPEQRGQALYSGAQKQSAYIHSIDPHTLAFIVGFASAFIPVVGPFVAAGIGMMDAGLYLKEGKKKEAAIVALFSLLPGIIKVTKLIPGVAELGTKGMAALGGKVASGSKLSSAEVRIVNSIASNQQMIKTEAEALAKTMAAQGASKVTNQATKKTLNHIAKHGLEKSVEHSLVHSAGEHGVEKLPKVIKSVGNAAAKIPKPEEISTKFGVASLR